MTKVYAGASMSLDGFIAGPDNSGFEHLFAWYENGDIAVETTHPEIPTRLTAVSAEYFQTAIDTTGALVVGRGVFDLTNGWDGVHPFDCPVVVLTHAPPTDWPHPDAPFHFVTEGIEAAVERAKALCAEGEHVGVAAGTVASQALSAGLVDELCIDLVPVLLGAGTRYFDDELAGAPLSLEGPISSVPGVAVTHLRYRVVTAKAQAIP